MFDKILLATDGSKTALKAARIANDYLAQGIAKKVTVLHIVNPVVNAYYNPELNSGIFEQIKTELQKKGEEVVEKTKEVFDSGANVEGVVKFGEGAAAICDFAADGYELIIIGSRGMNPISNLVLGSVSTRVIQYAPCPVLVVKPE